MLRADAYISAAYKTTDSQTVIQFSRGVGGSVIIRKQAPNGFHKPLRLITHLLQMGGIPPGIVQKHPQIFYHAFGDDLPTTHVNLQNLRNSLSGK